MTLIDLHPDDWAWMRRRLHGSAKGLAAMVLLSSLLQSPSPVPAQTSRSDGRPDTAAVEPQPAVSPSPQLSGEIQPSEAGQPQLNPVPPVGWRRTSRGWQHVSNWPTAKPSLNELIHTQRAEEPAWMQACFRRLRSVSPLAFALFQIVAVAFIAGASETKRLAARSLTNER